MTPSGKEAVNGENKHQPAVSGETGLLNSVSIQLSVSVKLISIKGGKPYEKIAIVVRAFICGFLWWR